MIFKELTWIRESAPKLEHNLRQDLMSMYQPARWIPCIFHKYFVKFRHKFTKVPVIIMTDEGTVGTRSDVKNMLQGYRFSMEQHIPAMNSFAGKLSVGAIKELAKRPEVFKIYQDGEVRAILDTAVTTVGSDRVWDAGFKGKGVTIAILDTGIAPHQDLNKPINRVIAFVDFVNKRTQPYDDNGHGTHVAGDAAGNGNESSGKYTSPAPEANLIGVKILNKDGSGKKSQVLAGIQWCIENRQKYNIKIINMSLGSRAESPSKDDPLCQGVEKAWDSGIFVCAAAGNEGPDNRTISSPGSDPKVLTVGAMDDRGSSNKDDDKLASFSSRGPTPDGLEKPDLVAPGVNIVSLRSPKSQLDKRNVSSRVDSSYFSLSGTSMATPIAAGVAAQVIESNNSLTPDELKKIMVDSADSLDSERNKVGAGYLNAKAAVAIAKKWRNI